MCIRDRFVGDALKGFVDSGVYERRASPWGSWAFATKTPCGPAVPSAGWSWTTARSTPGRCARGTR
eukprot:2241776-Alexandrium_andersonii.AAC.1